MHSKTEAGLFASILIMAASCASNEPPAEAPVVSSSAIEGAIRLSCPDGSVFVPPEAIAITTTKLDFADSTEKAQTAFGPLTPKTVYQIKSSDSRMGGLSGVDYLTDTSLILVSDAGSLVWINLDPETLEPETTAYIAALRDENGDILDGKKQADSEGVAWTGKHLFVSFERDHRVLAYDIEGCGSAARGIPVLKFPADGFGLTKAIDENRGIEALAATEDADLALGLETNERGAPVGLFGNVKQPGFSKRLPTPDITMLTGLDIVSGEGGPARLYSIMRSYDPLRGNRIAINRTLVAADGALKNTKLLTLFGTEVLVDNFEGIAAHQVSPDTDQIVIVSDDNFSDRQKTLLAFFETKTAN